VIYDLGSGEGTVLITAALEYGARGIGIEIDPFRAFFSRFYIYLRGASKKIKITRKNFFEVDLTDATVVFAYLIPKALKKLKLKFLKELKPGTRVVTFVYKMDLPLIASDTKNEIYVYKIPNRRRM
jgi:predicted RNA methylase